MNHIPGSIAVAKLLHLSQRAISSGMTALTQRPVKIDSAARAAIPKTKIRCTNKRGCLYKTNTAREMLNIAAINETIVEKSTDISYLLKFRRLSENVILRR